MQENVLYIEQMFDTQNAFRFQSYWKKKLLINYFEPKRIEIIHRSKWLWQEILKSKWISGQMIVYTEIQILE